MQILFIFIFDNLNDKTEELETEGKLQMIRGQGQDNTNNDSRGVELKYNIKTAKTGGHFFRSTRANIIINYS